MIPRSFEIKCKAIKAVQNKLAIAYEIAQSISCLAHHGILVVNLVTQTAAAAAANGGGAAAAGPQTAGQNSTGKNGVNTSQVHFR